jgi:hypothetical protein
MEKILVSLGLISEMPSCSLALLWTFSVLFGGTVKRSKRVAEFNEEEELMEAFTEQMKDEQPDDGAIEQDDDVYIP